MKGSSDEQQELVGETIDLEGQTIYPVTNIIWNKFQTSLRLNIFFR